jgi:hypothetical protein
MKLWMLRPVDEENGLWWYDCAHGFVIAAPSEDRARVIAAENAGDEGDSKDGNPWMDPTITTCTLLVPGDEGVLMRDFHAG